MVIRKERSFLLLFSMVFAFASVLLLTGKVGQAAENAEKDFETQFYSEAQDNTVEMLEGFHLELPEGDFDIEQSNEGLKNTVRLTDSETGDLIKEVTLEEEVSLQNAEAQNETFVTATSTTPHNGIDVTLNARVQIFSAGGAANQIEDVTDHWWTTSGGPHNLSASNSDLLSTSFPTNEIQVSGQTTIEVTIEADARGGFEGAGFTVEAGVGGEYNARKTVNDILIYSTDR